MSENDNNKTFTETQLYEIRQIITGLDVEDLTRLNKLLKDPDVFSEYIVDFLPASVQKLINNGSVSVSDIAPFVEQAIYESIKKDPQRLADVLYPVMGPAIRKAVAEDIKRMLESVNSVVENSFSLRRLSWRFQALFSGKSYAEVVLSHAYVYRVKQVFLIHRKTGLLLHQVADKNGGVTQDADMVSAMLSAVKDFVKDSFDVADPDNDLKTIQMGDHTIWIEQGPHAILAAIIEGRAPEDFKVVMKETLEIVHFQFISDLENFNGETDIFQKSDHLLRACLKKQERERKKKKPLAIIFLFILLVALAGYIVYNFVDENHRFNNFITKLNATSGIFVDNSKKSYCKRIIFGLKDPYAPDVYQIAGDYGFDTNNLVIHLKPYVSIEPAIVLKRVKTLIEPPAGYHLYFRNGVLRIEGNIAAGWAENVNRKVLTVPGVTKVVFDKIEDETTKKKVVKRGIEGIEKIFFVFKFNKIRLDSAQKIRFVKLIEQINKVYDFNFKQDSVPVIVVRAHTSQKGNKLANAEVALNRAEQFINLMVQAGIPKKTLVPKVLYIENENSPYPVRSVSFRVKYVQPDNL